MHCLLFFTGTTLLSFFQEKPDYEYSEMIMYEAQLLKESGQLKEVLKFLDDHDSHICDILAMQELKGEIN